MTVSTSRYRLRTGSPEIRPFSKDTSTTEILAGNLVINSSGKVTNMSTVTDNGSFMGVAMSDSPSGTTTKVNVAIADGKSEFDFPLDATTDLTYGLTMKWGASHTLSAQANGTDVIAFCVETASAQTSARVKFIFDTAMVNRG